VTDSDGSDRAEGGGSAAEFVVIFRAEAGYVWKSLRRLGVREADLEDVVHEVFLVFHKLQDRYDRSRPIRPYLFAIAARAASDYRRRAHHRREVLDDRPSREADGASSPEADVEARALVLRALDALAPDRRVVFVMHDLDGYSMPEIAAALAIPLNTGYSRLRLARADFSAALAKLRRAENARKSGPPT